MSNKRFINKSHPLSIQKSMNQKSFQHCSNSNRSSIWPKFNQYQIIFQQPRFFVEITRDFPSIYIFFRPQVGRQSALAIRSHTGKVLRFQRRPPFGPSRSKELCLAQRENSDGWVLFSICVVGSMINPL